MRCDGAGKGYECTPVDEPPSWHARLAHQPPWADEDHDIARDLPLVGNFASGLANEERKRLGHSSTEHDQTLSQIACWHNQDMIGHNYLGHDDPGDWSPQGRGARGALAEAFEKEGRENPFDGPLYVPTSPREFRLRLRIPEQGGRYAVVKGPRGLIPEEGPPAYEHAF